MHVLRSTRAARAASFSAVVVAVLALVAAARLTALAAPTAASDPSPMTVSLEQSSTAVPLDGDFGYTAHIRLDEPASYLQARLQVHRQAGKLVYQRTLVENSLPAGEHDLSFSRPIDGLDLKPGAYPADLEVRAQVGGSTITTDIAVDLLVFDADKPAVPVVLIARVHGQPMFDPAGLLALDPAVETAQRDQVDRVASLAFNDSAARITLAVPPVMLSDWKRISTGFTAPDGRTAGADDPVALAYAGTLAHLRAALDTGRLELVTLGYTDPDLTALSAESLASDVGPQYDSGISAVFASLEVTPSVGTVPAGDCAPASTLTALADDGIGYVATSASCTRVGKNQAPTGAYPVKGARMTAIVVDDQSSTALSSAETSTAVRRIFNRATQGVKNPQVFAVRVDLGAGGNDATTTVGAALGTFESLPWVRLIAGREATTPPGAKLVSLREGATADGAPAGYWRTVRSARSYARGMLAGLGPGDSGAVSANANSLLAESSAWAEPLGRWGFSERGKAFADESLKTSRAVLDEVFVKATSVTFAGAKGEVPVTITNRTQNTLSLVLRTKTSGGIRVVGSKDIKTVLRPQETYVQVPIDMRSALSGKLVVEVVADDLVIAKSTADVRASYLDRLAMIGGIIVVLGIMLAFIVGRVRRAERMGSRAEAAPDADEQRERYTEAGADHMDGTEE